MTLVSPVLRAELRDSAPAWAAVALTFISTTLVLVLSALVLESGLAAVTDGGVADEGMAYAFSGAMNLVICSVVALAVISSSTGLVVAARRPAIARLALAGATPGQIVRLTVGQLVAVTVVSALIGATLAVILLPATLNFLAKERALDGPTITPDPVVSPLTVVLVALLAVVLAVLGGLRQALAASRVGPLEAAREATTGASSQSTARLVGRWVLVALLSAGVVGAIAAMPALVDQAGQEAGSTLLQLCFVVLALAGVALSVAAPMVVAPLTRAWTRLVPGRSASWHLASRTVVVRSDRLVRSVVPVMFSIGLVLGMVAIGATFNATFAANGMDIELSGVSAATVLGTIGPALLIAVSGALGNLIMMSRARESELAVSGLIGTTPAQRIATTLLEAAILTVTGTLLALVMVGATVTALRVALAEMMPEVAMAIPVSGALLVALAVGVAAGLATTLPILRSLRLPEREVVATHLAD